MPKVMKVCKACGKEYEACHTPNPGVFRWRDFACSYECAMKYIHDVEVARGNIVEEPEKKPEEPRVMEPVVEDPKSVETEQFSRNADDVPRFMRKRKQ